MKTSRFKDEFERETFFDWWVAELETANSTNYEKIEVSTSLGKTVVWGIGTHTTGLDALVIFPGFRTTALFWDLDHALLPLKEKSRIFLVETNGQPNLSDGNSPLIKGDGYGHWATEVLQQLSIDKAIVAGASFGGLVCLKLSAVAPQLIKKCILLNPGCLAPFSLSPKNLYYNFLPILRPSRKNTERFLDHAVLNGSAHCLSEQSRTLLTDYEVFVLKSFIDNTQKPYAFKAKELAEISSDIYLILGSNDVLFPYKSSKRIAEEHLRNLKDTVIVSGVGHGIETTREGILAMADIVGCKTGVLEKER